MKATRRVFLCKLPLANYIIMGIMCAVMVPFAILGFCRVAEVGELYSVNVGFDITASVLEIVVTVFIVMLTLLTRYVVTPRYLAFQRILSTKIPIEKLLMIRHEISENLLVLYYADEHAPDGVRLLVLRVFASKQQAIVQAIQEANHAVSYEMFDASRQKRDE